jgi:phospholipase/carboxylesterase
LPPVGRYFTEAAFHHRLADLDPDPPRAEHIGLHSTGDPGEPGERGGFCLYVPEHYDESRQWPLVVTLHGGSGSGREYLWLWLREARSRGFLLLAPTSIGPTWSMIGPDVDATAIDSMIEYVGSRWSVNRNRVLLTGLSDGATYGLTLAFAESSKFTCVAPIAGVLHPALAAEGRLRGAGKRIYLVHGALDWMFPVEYARAAHEQLARAGADVVYREIADLSHTYPREENDRILAWFDASLALPPQQAS